MSTDSQPPVPAPASQGRVLVIDDEPGIRRFALRVLENAGYAVIEAGDGLQGLELFGREKHDIAAVLMDLSMPGMEGRELVHELRRLARDIPILVMSGYGNAEAEAKLNGAVVNDFVHKPFRPHDLIERLVRATGNVPDRGE